MEYFDSAVNATSHTIFEATAGNIPVSLTEIVIRTITASTIINTLYLILTESQFQFLAFWFRRGVLVRVQETLPEDRDLVQFWIGTSSVTLPMALFQVLNKEHFEAKTVFEWNFLEIGVLTMAILLAVDAWYFFGHRYMHKNKWFWNNVHKHHHEKKNINVYSTAYAAFIENLILITPVVLTCMVIYDSISPKFNRLAWHLALIAQGIIFNLGHCGYRFHSMMHFMVPPNGFLHQIFRPWDLSQVPEDHESHHLYPLANFGLNFRIWDSWFGSYKPVEHVIALRQKGKKE
ncbi:hypothetical protein HDU97_000963 [Phlyctochytrium planicorne]|nr:hypothetical protein HDU97_000963 [Phlyctochytrium planicorne]